MEFKLHAPFQATGDQPEAIAALARGVELGLDEQVLLGVTGSGKTFTMASVIEKVQRPTLVLAHNKTLAAQLCAEFKEFFPENAVEYFVSYYDYYQPEAYIPHHGHLLTALYLIALVHLQAADDARHLGTHILMVGGLVVAALRLLQGDGCLLHLGGCIGGIHRVEHSALLHDIALLKAAGQHLAGHQRFDAVSIGRLQRASAAERVGDIPGLRHCFCIGSIHVGGLCTLGLQQPPAACQRTCADRGFKIRCYCDQDIDCYNNKREYFEPVCFSQFSPVVLQDHKSDTACGCRIQFRIMEPAVHMYVSIIVQRPFRTGCRTDIDGNKVHRQYRREYQETCDSSPFRPPCDLIHDYQSCKD